MSNRNLGSVREISGAAMARLDQRARELDAAKFRAHPEMKMPVFIGRANPRLQVRWQPK